MIADTTYDTLQAHLSQAGDIGRASVPMGMLLAWCVNMQLVSAQCLSEHERLILRLRYQEAQGSELLIACGGDLYRELFNARGQAFLDEFYPQFMSTYARLLAPAGGDVYDVKETWANYSTLATELTRLLLTGSGVRRRGAGRSDGVLKTLSRWFRG